MNRIALAVLWALLASFLAPRAFADAPASSSDAGVRGAAPLRIGDPVPQVLPPDTNEAPQAASPQVSPAPDAVSFVGQSITAIDVQVDDDAWPTRKPPVVTTVRPGQVLRPPLVRKIIDEVLQSGQFAKARVSAVLEGSGVRLVVHLVQRRLIENLRVDLHSVNVERDELLREADLAEGGEVIGIELPEYKERIRHYLARRGYPSPSVDITSRETDDPTRVLVIVDVAPGVPRILARRGFYVFDADARALSSTVETYRVAAFARADETALDAADSALEARLRTMGYHAADVSHDVVLASGLVTLRVRIDAGPHYKPKFEGNDHYDSDALSGALALDEETDLAPGHLVQKVKDFYVKRGYLDVEVALEPRGTEADKTRALVFHIFEHDRVAVGARAYPCLKQDEIKKLNQGGPQTVGEIGSEIDSYLEEELPGADVFRDPDPRGLDKTITGNAGDTPVPTDLDPDTTYVAETYERAVAHVQELYRNEGYLHATVGPIQVVRRQCDRRSPPGKCIPIAQKPLPVDECAYDATNLPLPVPPLDDALTCSPDPLHGIECEPRVTLRIPIKLGPRTFLWDMSFDGARSIAETKLARAADIPLGAPVNSLKIDEARRRILDLYKEEGYYFADVKYTLDSSVDHTRARVRFDITEGDQVIVRQIVIRGNEVTSDWTIRRRIALEVGQPFRTSDVRKTQERIATLNVFSNISIGLEEPYVPQKNKVVVIRVTERRAQTIEGGPGLSTGEGIRGEIGYSHANIGGDAIGLSFRLRLSYLPDELILDPVVRKNFDSLSQGFSGARLATRLTTSLSFPEIGLGPLVRMQIDGVYVHDLEHDFVLDKVAGIPGIYFRPFRELLFALSQSFEHNNVRIFGFDTIRAYLQNVFDQTGSNADLSRLLRIPDGPSHAFAQRFVVTYDHRDNSFNPHRGSLFVSGLEHVDWFAEAHECVQENVSCSHDEGHTLRFTETFAVYVPVTKTMTLAAELRAGTNVQLVRNSVTYTDRLFFLGGVESLRGYTQDSLIAQEDADSIAGSFNKADGDPTKFTIDQVGVRGGDLMINPRVELRIPVKSPVETVLFLDAGNIWKDATYILDHGISLRTAVGSGLRIVTPIGPLAFDYGINTSRLAGGPNSPRYRYEDFGAFHFAIGLF